MSNRCSLLVLSLALIAVVIAAGPAHSQSRAVAEAAALTRMIEDEVIETKDFTNPMTMKDALQHFYEMFAAKGKELPILVDIRAFRSEDETAPNVYDVQVQLPTVPKQLPMHVA